MSKRTRQTDCSSERTEKAASSITADYGAHSTYILAANVGTDRHPNGIDIGGLPSDRPDLADGSAYFTAAPAGAGSDAHAENMRFVRAVCELTAMLDEVEPLVEKARRALLKVANTAPTRDTRSDEERARQAMNNLAFQDMRMRGMI